LNGGEEEATEPRGGGGVASLMRFLEEDVEGGVLGRGEEELERFLYSTLAIPNRHDGSICGGIVQVVELQNICVGVRSTDNQGRTISASWVSSASPRCAVS
jgi:hypothetical protein